ncbi:MAG: hypothetical protein HQ490_10190 [Lutibacter sp.]|nr:hypothetical protein [Lutibacter sp.]
MNKLTLYITNITNSFNFVVTCDVNDDVKTLKELIASKLEDNNYHELFRIIHKGY